MPNRIISFAHIGFLLLSALTAALLLSTTEARLAVTQHSAAVWIVKNDNTSSKQQIGQTVGRVAEEQNIAIGFAYPDVRSPESMYHMHLAVGDSDSKYADWLENGYPSFGHTIDVRVHPLDEFGGVVSPRGFYLIFGPPENKQVLTDALAEHGLKPSTGGTPTKLWHAFKYGAMFNILAVALLVGVTAVGAGVLLDSKRYGVQRLQGRSYGRILLADLVRVARLWSLALPATAALTLVILGFYNGWNQLDYFAQVAFILLGILTAVASATHAAVLGVVHTTAVLPALNGRIPVRTALVSAYLVRLPVLVLVLAILGSVVQSVQSVRAQEASLTAFEQTGDTVRITMSGSLGFDEMDTASAPIGNWLRDADRAGEAVLTRQVPTPRILPPGEPRPDFPVLVVNDTYLAEQEIVSPTGERYGPAESEDRIRVLLPETHSSYRDEIARRIPGWARFQADDDNLDPEVRILPAADGQSVFTYGSAAPFLPEERPFLHNPVVVALPNGAVFSDSTYTNSMTSSAIVFPDPSAVQRARNDPQMAEYINTVQSLRNEAARDYASELTRLRIESFNLTGASAVLLLTAIAVCIVAVRARAQTVFARHISGWTFLATHRRFLAVEAAIALAFVGWFTWDTLAALQARRTAAGRLSELTTTGFEPVYAAGIAAVGLALTVGALAVFHRRIVREGASQA